ncbi:LysR substrate-binding domain-containing protein [Desulfospira joergensenii]|uniref:LysR substrate-binding domain-containing protein n=1 Tax=Desulfospira joergensenii TaxID=53329 RepID=UPI0003B720C0|nr:LysR substrate-binding domain-containing protein [Desulfospira joergensenii]
MDLTPDILRTFVAAAQTLNFTQAAQRVNLTQSAVSIQVRKLEENLGKPLFKRMPRGVELTDHGETLLTYANRILQLNHEAMALFKEPDLNGLIRIGSAEDYAALHLPGILRRFAEKYPLVEVDLFCDLSNELLEMLEQGKIDICLRNTQQMEPGGVFLRREPVIWVGPRDTEPERKSPLPIAVFHQGCIYRQWAIQALEKQNIPYRIAYSSPSISGILAAVRTGLAVAPVGASTSIPGLRRISPEKLPELPSATVSLHQSECPDDGAQAHLVQYIMDEFCAMPQIPARLRPAG